MKSLLGAISIVSFIIVVLFSSWCLAANLDPSGTWNFNLSDSQVEGMCPMGGDGRGSLSITEKGNGKYVLKYLKGMGCRPTKVCILSGSCNGSECVFSTTVGVDSEGGKVTNTAKLQFDGNRAKGSGVSQYSHPSMSCSWSFLLILNK